MDPDSYSSRDSLIDHITNAFHDRDGTCTDPPELCVERMDAEMVVESVEKGSGMSFLLLWLIEQGVLVPTGETDPDPTFMIYAGIFDNGV